jgi:hypothetical protein
MQGAHQGSRPAHRPAPRLPRLRHALRRPRPAAPRLRPHARQLRAIPHQQGLSRVFDQSHPSAPARAAGAAFSQPRLRAVLPARLTPPRQRPPRRRPCGAHRLADQLVRAGFFWRECFSGAASLGPGEVCASVAWSLLSSASQAGGAHRGQFTDRSSRFGTGSDENTSARTREVISSLPDDRFRAGQMKRGATGLSQRLPVLDRLPSARYR